jgi:riboflavin synthase
MFTGLIEAVCSVTSAYQAGSSMRLAVDLDRLTEDAKIGDSIAVNGACLTIAELQASVASFDISSETMAKTALSNLRPASKVNIERALKPSDRLGGHCVLGHIDGTAKVKAIDRQGEFADMKFAARTELLDQMVVKGSVAVDGISLTITNVDRDCFTVSLIPETLKRTTLGATRVGDTVNIETDVIVKIVKRYLEKILPDREQLTVEKLQQLGF